MALTWVKIANLKGPKGDKGDQGAAGNVSAWKANTSYLAGQTVVSPGGDLVTAKTSFTSGSSYSASNWNASGQDGRIGAIESAGYIPAWKPSTAYVAGQSVASPGGDIVTSKASHTSGASFTPANWNASTQDGRIAAVESKNTDQDGRLNGIVMPNTTNLNTLKTTNTYYIGTPVDWVGQNFPLNATVRLRSDFWTANDGIQVATVFGSTQYTYSRISNSGGFGAWSQSNEVRLTTNEAKNAAQDGRLDSLESATLIYTNGYVTPPVQYTPDANTKGLWRFDDTLTDSSGNGYTLSQVSTYSGTYSTDAKFGTKSLNGGLYQNTGADTFLSSTGTTGGTLTTGTVECWVRSTPHTATKVAVSHRNWFWLGMAANGTPLAKYGTGANEKTITGTTVMTATPYSSTVWYHLALVFDGANGVRLYVNGKLEGSNAAVETVGDQSPGPGFTVGGLQGAGAPAFNWELSAGRIDEVRLSNVARYAAAPSYPARPAGLKQGAATFVGPVIPPGRQPFDQWLKTETA